MKNIQKKLPLFIKRPIKKSINFINYLMFNNTKIKSKFSNKSGKRIIMIGTPTFGNLGDHAIAKAESKFFTDFYPEHEYIEVSYLNYFYEKNKLKKLVRDNEVIVIHGGGFLGNLWIDAEYMVRDIIKNYPKNPIIIMPQTIYFDNKENSKKEVRLTKKIYETHNDLTLLLREKQSFDLARELFSSKVSLYLVADIVTYLNESEPKMERKHILQVLRDDHEKVDHSTLINKIHNQLDGLGVNFKKIDNVLPFNFNEIDRNYYLEEQFKNFRESRLIVTDRLHGMIFALITGTPCIAMNNISGKVKGVYNWIEDYEYIKCVGSSIEDRELEILLNKLLNDPFPEAYSHSEKIKDQLEIIKNLFNEKLRVGI